MFLFDCWEFRFLSLLTKLWIVCLLGTLSLQNLCRNFLRYFLADFISHTCHTEIYAVLKYTAPQRTTLIANCNWEHTANGADNSCLLPTNHKETPTHEPHCSPWNIIPSSCPQVNYFPSLQTLSVIRHADSSTEFLWISRQAAHRSLWSAEPWTGQQS
jgi:hypothetical protein